MDPVTISLLASGGMTLADKLGLFGGGQPDYSAIAQRLGENRIRETEQSLRRQNLQLENSVAAGGGGASALVNAGDRNNMRSNVALSQARASADEMQMRADMQEGQIAERNRQTMLQSGYGLLNGYLTYETMKDPEGGAKLSGANGTDGAAGGPIVENPMMSSVGPLIPAAAPAAIPVAPRPPAPPPVPLTAPPVPVAPPPPAGAAMPANVTSLLNAWPAFEQSNFGMGQGAWTPNAGPAQSQPPAVATPYRPVPLTQETLRGQGMYEDGGFLGGGDPPVARQMTAEEIAARVRASVEAEERANPARTYTQNRRNAQSIRTAENRAAVNRPMSNVVPSLLGLSSNYGSLGQMMYEDGGPLQIMLDEGMTADGYGGDGGGGRRNGQLADNELTSAYGGRFEAATAAAWDRMVQDAAQAGIPIQPSSAGDTYRPLSVQQRVHREKPNMTAVPGTSNHGWGNAVDVATGYLGHEPGEIGGYDSATYRWMAANAGRYGFTNPDWARQGGNREEPWHWEYAAPAAPAARPAARSSRLPAPTLARPDTRRPVVAESTNASRPVRRAVRRREDGGSLIDGMYEDGGALIPVGPPEAGAVEVVGPSHAEGGVDISPTHEVEGGETIDHVAVPTANGGQPGGYVFSDNLLVPDGFGKISGRTFAAAHKMMLDKGADDGAVNALAEIQESVSGRDEAAAAPAAPAPPIQPAP